MRFKLFIKRFHFRQPSKLLFLISLAVYACTLPAQERRDYTQVIAALTLNFAKYTSWPDEPKFSLEVCYFDELYKDGFDLVQGKVVNNATIKVKRINRVADSKSCDVIFLSEKDNNRLRRLFSAIGTQAKLTISDQSGFLAEGGMIELYQNSNKMSFDIANTLVERNGLKISAQVLKLAGAVK